MKRDEIIASYVKAGYPKEYILGQEAAAWKHVRNGTRPDGNASDMECEFYVNAPQNQINRGIKEK